MWEKRVYLYKRRAGRRFLSKLYSMEKNIFGRREMKEKNLQERGDICPCDETCAIGKAVKMIGGRWKLRILCALTLDGTQRYNDIKKKMVGIAPTVLSSTMKELEQDGLVTRMQYEEIPPRVEYTITKRGRQLWPILHRLVHWAKDETFDSDDEIIGGNMEESK